MADYLHRLPATDKFWDVVEQTLVENEDKMQELAKQRKIARKFFKRAEKN